MSVLNAGSTVCYSTGLVCRSHCSRFFVLFAGDSVTTVSPLAFAVESAESVGASGEAMAIVILGLAFVSIRACAPVADKVYIRKSFVSAATFKRADSVYAFSIGIAIVSAFGAFVNVFARDTVSRISISTSTVETALCVCADGVFGTVCFLGFAFVDIGAFESVAAEIGVSFGTCAALAVVGTDNVGAFGVLVAFVASVGAFISVCALHAVALKPTLACTGVAANSIFAGGKFVAIVLLRFAFINILACEAVALEVFKVGEAGSAAATERARQVCTFGIGIAIVASVGTFVNVGTCDTVAAESRIASALERSDSVHATRILRAVVCHQLAFVHILTSLSIASVSRVTSARKATIKVGTGSIDVAIVSTRSTLVIVGT